MAKVLLVEDDNNLREIYQARLSAEGYDIVTAQNGEEALSVAKQNHPDLIISDVMMPRISGFEMLDILRNTDELKHTKVIMLTALGQAEDRSRAQGLGADKYLVKSQVTLEDIVNCAHDLLSADVPGAAALRIVNGSVHTSAGDRTMLEQNALDSAAAADTAQSATPAGAPPTSVDKDKAPILQHSAPGLTPPPQPSLSPTALAELQNMPAAPSQQPGMSAISASPVVLDSFAQTVTVPPSMGAQPSSAAATQSAQTLNSDEVAIQAQLSAPAEPDAATAPQQAQPAGPVTPAPASIAPAPSPNDQVIDGAVAELTGTAPKPQPASVQPPQPAAQPAGPVTPAPASIAPTAAMDTESENPHTAEEHNPVTTALGGTKVIMPTSGMLERPDLQTLLAREEAKGDTSSVAPAAGSSITPSPTPSTPASAPADASSSAKPFDPNNVAL